MAEHTLNSGSLLLLPIPAVPLLRHALTETFGPPISAVISLLAKTLHHDEQARLDIAVSVLPSLSESQQGSRAYLFPTVQNILEEIYRLICVLAAQNDIELDFPGGIDARVFMVETLEKSHPNATAQQALKSRATSGPLIDFPTLTSSGRCYEPLFAVETKEGEGMLQTFLTSSQQSNFLPGTIRRVPSGISMLYPNPSGLGDSEGNKPRDSHVSVAVGGTFDHLHIGHKLLLTATAFLIEPQIQDPTLQRDRTITIGITGDELLRKKKYPDQMESWEDRQESVQRFIESILVFSTDEKAPRQVERISDPGPNGKFVRVTIPSSLTVNYVQISDPFGPTITDQAISALVISKETRAGGKAVNDRRTEKGWPALEVFEVDVLDAGPGSTDGPGPNSAPDAFEFKISSTDIRRRLEQRLKSS